MEAKAKVSILSTLTHHYASILMINLVWKWLPVWEQMRRKDKAVVFLMAAGKMAVSEPTDHSSSAIRHSGAQRLSSPIKSFISPKLSQYRQQQNVSVRWTHSLNISTQLEQQLYQLLDTGHNEEAAIDKGVNATQSSTHKRIPQGTD